ncbi:MAG: helix-turn-helix domain-containing protein [Xanthobacteraceae bacterium]
MKPTTAPRAQSPDTEPTSCRLPKTERSEAQRTDHRDEEPVGQRQRVGQHGHIFREGDRADRIYQVVDGAVMLYKLLPDGRRQVVELLSADDVFGLTALPIYDCSAETLVASNVIAYDRASVEHSQELLRRLSAHVHAQLCALHEHAVLLGRKSALERVATFVMHCVPGRGGFACAGPRAGGDSAVVRLGMTRQEIADYLGLTLETVSRAFSELRRRGIIAIDKQEEVRVHDVCRMCQLTGAH